MKLFSLWAKKLIQLSAFTVLISCASEPAKTVEVAIYKMEFTPQIIEINQGDTVVWINKEKRQYHNVWFEELGDEEPEYMFPDEIYQKTFPSKGDFNYHCGPHPKMTGIVKVK